MLGLTYLIYVYFICFLLHINQKSLLTYPAYVFGLGKHTIVAEKMVPAKDAPRPSFNLLPVAMIVAKDLVVFNQFDSKEKNLHEKCTKVDVDAKVSYGPFSLNNKTSKMDAATDEDGEEFKAKTALRFNSPQIIGFLCAWNEHPYPAKDSPKPAPTPNIATTNSFVDTANGAGPSSGILGKQLPMHVDFHRALAAREKELRVSSLFFFSFFSFSCLFFLTFGMHSRSQIVSALKMNQRENW